MDDSLRVVTDTPVALDSPDHLTPWGTARDNSKNIRFNHKLLRLFNHLSRPLQVLDLGCSGGGFVRSLLDVGQFAVGIGLGCTPGAATGLLNSAVQAG